MKTILIVDDEIPILKSLMRLFIDSKIEALTAENGLDALEIIKNHKIDLVISDMRMPLMDGYEFLSQVKKEYPEIIRVILSGYSEEKTIFRALLHNIAHLYLFKPWNNAELIRSIEQLLETADILSSADLLVLFNNLEGLPTIPSVYQEILEMIDSDADILDVAAAIEKDPSISTRLLHVANSAFSDLHTGSVKQAAIHVGLPNIRSLICSTSVLDLGAPEGTERILAERLWKHSLLTSKLLHFLYDEVLQKKMPEAAYSAGLLHNIGLLLLLHGHHLKLTKMIQNAWTEDIHFLDYERAEFGVTHQEVGGYLAQWWGLPFPIVEVALYHHRPLESGIINAELVYAVHIAQHYAWILMGEPVVAEFFPDTFGRLGLSSTQFENLVKDRSWFEA